MTVPQILPTSTHLEIDPEAARFVKDETVGVVFAKQEGALGSLEGPNTFVPGDALVTAQSGERWVVSADRFAAKYRPLVSGTSGTDGQYKNRPIPVWAKRIDQPFSIARCEGGDVLTGQCGDWLLQYAPGDFGVVQQTRFARIYHLAEAVSAVCQPPPSARNTST